MKRFILSVLLVCCVALLPALAAAEAGTLTVTGTATVTVEADTAVVSIGVETVDKDVSAAASSNAAKMDAVVAALKALGIDEKDIVTSHYFVSTLYDYSASDGETVPVRGYQVSNSLSVKVRDITQTGAVIDTALKAGANACNGISFTSGAAGEACDQALTAAIAEARRKAALAAEACGGTVGRIVELKEGYGSYGGVTMNKRTAAAGAMVEEAADAGTAIIADGLQFSATVTLTVEIE